MKLLTAITALGLLILSPPPAAAQSLEQSIRHQLDGLKARSSFFAKHLSSGKTIELRADLPMNTLSVIKLPVMVLMFRDAEAGKVNLDDRYTIRPQDQRRGSGLLQNFAPGLAPTYRDLITQMIITSDNTATDILIHRVGVDRVNALLAEQGYKVTRLQCTTGDLFRFTWIDTDPANARLSDLEVFTRGFPTDSGAAKRFFQLEGDAKRWLGVTTAREISRLVEQIYKGELTSKDHAKEMIDMMLAQFSTSRLPARLQWEGARIAHKTGDWPPYAGNDVGVIFYPGGPAIVSVFTSQNTGSFFDLEATEGKIAEELVHTWK